MNFEQTVARIADLKALIAAQTEEIENLYASLPQSKKIDTYPAGRYILRVTDNRRFDPATAIKALSAAKVKAISVSKPDSATAKRVLSGDDYAKCQRSFGVKREVIEVTDEDTNA